MLVFDVDGTIAKLHLHIDGVMAAKKSPGQAVCDVQLQFGTYLSYIAVRNI